MNAGACIRLVTLLCFFQAARALAQEACVDGCRFPDYPDIQFRLGEGFIAKGAEVSVTHMGFLHKGAYNNDGSIQSVGLPTLVGELYFLDPVTGREMFLFKNQVEGVTHQNDSGKVVSLGNFPKGAPIVFRFKNTSGPENKRFDRFTGSNETGVHDFTGDPVLQTLFINGKPKPRSGGFWNWSGEDHYQWAVAGMVPGTDVKQFQFEDLDDRRFNDIVFRVSGVGLTSENFKLEPPAILDTREQDGRVRIAIQNSAASVNRDARILYTLDGTLPTFDAFGTPTGSTKAYESTFVIERSATIRALAWKPGTADADGNTVRYDPSDIVTDSFEVTRKRWSTPVATPHGGAFLDPVSVALAQTEGARMYYVICEAGTACPAPTAASRAYSGTSLTISPGQTLKVIASQAPNDDSEVAEFLFHPEYRVVDAQYLDRDSDGRIETARIPLKGKPALLPAGVLLEDPFGHGAKREVPGADLAWETPDRSVVIARFAAKPFEPGTGFPTAPYGAFKAGMDGYETGPFLIRDGAGPVLLSAEAEISLDSGSYKRLKVRFSEPLLEAGRTGALPFVIKRRLEDVSGALAVSEAAALEDGVYLYTFTSPVFPVPGDSARASPSARDGVGNASGTGRFVEVRGKRLLLASRIKVSGGGCARSGRISDPTPRKIPIKVFEPVPEKTGATCSDGLPAIKVSTRWPFAFDLRYFNTLGEFVNAARGEVSGSMLQGIAPDALGNRTVGLQWYPVDARGAQAGTGAYIVQGSVTIGPEAAKDFFQGLPVTVQPATEKFRIRFGYIRE